MGDIASNMQSYPTIYRRRYIPDEKVCLKNDSIVHYNGNVLITKWQTLRPRPDFDRGSSCYLIDKGIKISKFCHGDRLIYHYIDIIETQILQDSNEIVFNDLLIDIIVENTGIVKLVDLEQIPMALERGLITNDQAMYALRNCAWLLDILYKGRFDELLEYF
ncbi:MAG: DUF402 domain-containing protein [Defluviitaleaceae bacterium]|nr:DUF402 domain-containing protein [Defluviitaleaceae bacterium]